MRFAKLALVAVLLTGCAAGPDGQRAQELLQQAQTANANMKSATYVATVAFAGEGQEFN
jgi:PBP1b-binding outer membrane lipoprotein LpoB